MILDGDIWHGIDGMAGEIGHMTIDYNGPLCGCGSRGCLETYVSAKVLEQKATELIKAHDDSFLAQVFHSHEDRITAEMIFEGAKKGDRDSLHLFHNLGRFLGIGLSSLVNLLNIEMIILGGGLSKAFDYFIEDTRKELLERSFVYQAKKVNIVRAEIPNDLSGVVGACYLPLKYLNGFKEG